jgi:hypothetical protein
LFQRVRELFAELKRNSASGVMNPYCQMEHVDSDSDVGYAVQQSCSCGVCRLRSGDLC